MIGEDHDCECRGYTPGAQGSDRGIVREDRRAVQNARNYQCGHSRADLISE